MKLTLVASDFPQHGFDVFLHGERTALDVACNLAALFSRKERPENLRFWF
jgi:hypothetical protein